MKQTFGLCCISNELARKGFKFRTLTFKRFQELGRERGLKQLGEVIENNLKVTGQIISQCARNGWKIKKDAHPYIYPNSKNIYIKGRMDKPYSNLLLSKESFDAAFLALSEFRDIFCKDIRNIGFKAKPHRLTNLFK